MFGSISEWFYRSLLGINPGAPGFSKIIIKPQPAGDLTWAKGSYNSVRGDIVSDWKISGNSFVLNVSVPPNTIAEIWVPAAKNSQVTESSRSLESQKLTNQKTDNGYVIVNVGSGNYEFTSSLIK
jgi:alpha-L-rhamnosidase